MNFLRAFAFVLGVGLLLIAGAWIAATTVSDAKLPGAIRNPLHTPTLAERQDELVAAAVDRLRPQRPGRIDLFTLGFAGDGTERVFANEVEYFAQLMSQRFDAQGHTLSLVNAPAGTPQRPMATLHNLRQSLQGLGKRMDTREDVLVLFLTSHGSSEFEFVVDQPPLNLQPIRPLDLRRALDDSGIQWRVVVVSSCYSGGFIDPLRDPRTLVITAARRDRTSFGCGSESKITYFGDAFLANALNQTTDFPGAFERARVLVAEWEQRDRETPSEPQMWVGEKIGPKLVAWGGDAQFGPPVAFTGK